MAIRGILRRGAHRLAFAGDVEVNLFRAQRDPHIGSVRTSYAMVEVNLAKPRTINRSFIWLVQSKCAFEYVHRADKVRDKAVGGIFVQVRWRRELRDFAFVDHRNAAGHRQCLILVMRHGDEGNADLVL